MKFYRRAGKSRGEGWKNKKSYKKDKVAVRNEDWKCQTVILHSDKLLILLDYISNNILVKTHILFAFTHPQIYSKEIE